MFVAADAGIVKGGAEAVCEGTNADVRGIAAVALVVGTVSGTAELICA
jgi:hypothetical protein